MQTPNKYNGLTGTERLAALERDCYTCQDCGFAGQPGYAQGTLQVHHIKPSRLGGSNELDNLVTLCTACHKKRDRAYWAESMSEWQSRLGFKKLTHC